MTSKCWIQSDATVSSSKKTALRNSWYILSYLTMKSVPCSCPKVELPCGVDVATDFQFRCLNLQIVVLSSMQANLFEPSILGLLRHSDRINEGIDFLLG